jgi:hypothetical protein
MPDGSTLHVERQTINPLRGDSRTKIWDGVVDQLDKGWFSHKTIATGKAKFAIVDDVTWGIVRMRHGPTFQIRPIGKDQYVVEQLDMSKFPRESPDNSLYKPSHGSNGRKDLVRVKPKTNGNRRAYSGALTNNQQFSVRSAKVCQTSNGIKDIDVMVLYTEGALSEVEGGASNANSIDSPKLFANGMEAGIGLMISETEDSFANSKVDAHVSKSFTGATKYVEFVHSADGSRESSEDFSNLRESEDNLDDPEDEGNNFPSANGPIPIADAAKIRRKHRADVVVMLTRQSGTETSPGDCGAAMTLQHKNTNFASDAYAVVPWNCAAANLSFAHELGHLLGSQHEKPAEDGVEAFGHGYIYCDPVDKTKDCWRTIMAERGAKCSDRNKCDRLPLWSNPNVFEENVPAGAGDANNAASINETAGLVASYQCRRD